MNKKRTRLEVIRDILEVISDSRKIKITHVIYKANLSNNSVKPYLDELIGKGFVREVFDKDKKYFEISDKGKEFLKEFEKIKVFSDAYGL